MKSLTEIENSVLELTSPNDRIVHGIWSVDCLYNPVNNGRTFNYKFIVSQTTGQGCAYSTNYDYPPEYLSTFIGTDFIKHDIDDIALRVSFLDSIYGQYFPGTISKLYESKGKSDSKLAWRSSIIMKEAVRLLGTVKNKHILNVGVVGDIIYSFKREGAYVVGADFDSSIVGNRAFDGITVVNGKHTLEELSNADLAVVTGMTITTQTIDDIILCSQKKNVKLIVFAETGANLADYYIKAGVDVYLSEEFPFYIFNGSSTIRVYRS